MLYNKGNHAQLKRVQPQPSRLQGENGGKIYSTWNPGYSFKNLTELTVLMLQFIEKSSPATTHQKWIDSHEKGIS